MNQEEVEKVLDELQGVRPEKLNGEAKRLFEAIMTIADSRDKAEADLYEANNRINDLLLILGDRDRMIDLMVEHIYAGCDFDNRIKTKEQIRKYFEKEIK